MPLHVLCPSCHMRYEVADEQAGGTATCPGCRMEARIPPIGPAPPGAGRQANYPVSPYASPQTVAMASDCYQGHLYEQAASRFEVHRRLIGIFGLVVGMMNILLAAFYGFVVALVNDVALPNPPPPGELEAARAVYVGLAAITALTALVQIAASFWLLCRYAGCRKMGIAASIVSCISIWGCFVWPFSLAHGIYALAMLCGRDAATVLQHRPLPPSMPVRTPGPTSWNDGEQQ